MENEMMEMNEIEVTREEALIFIALGIIVGTMAESEVENGNDDL